ncbi:LysE family translocator [Halarcobacter bivalviorum]|uniref:LysE family translocator n=1 Tax=Halarcobacter bivalviorum TaxID=663364 RepID=UPI00100BEE52|nr:LysE family transporter [Halarcobacter bivalviorum]RXK07238.1 lysine transporter LysE [Halarcobacter bivalviorum]
MSLFLAMCTFSLVMSITPGPVNLIIVNSGINNGLKKTFAFISGATIGFTLLLLLIGLGLNTFIAKQSSLFTYLSIGSSLFIIYIGYKIIKIKENIDIYNNEEKTPYFYEGFLIQWLNPKAWIASISGVSLFSSSDFVFYSFILIYFFICYLSLIFWGYIGEKVSYLLKIREYLKYLNIIMGSLLILSAMYLFYIQFI